MDQAAGGGESVGAMRAQIEEAFSSRDEPQRRATRPERRGMDALRSEAQWTVVTEPPRPRLPFTRPLRRNPGASLRRFALLGVALVAGGLAAALVLQRTPAPAAVPLAEPVIEVAVPLPRVLVAGRDIAMGERVGGGDLVWAEWPEAGLQSAYITHNQAPEAGAELVGAVARSEILSGEPIRAEKLVHGAPGLLSAVLEEGMRGVSVAVSAETAAGGFIFPGDRVDVLVTRPTASGQLSQTILHNVRVLAIGQRLDTAPAEGAEGGPASFVNEAVATLALDAAETEVIINAASSGRLSLVLRSLLDVAERMPAENLPVNEALRVTSPFWVDQ